MFKKLDLSGGMSTPDSYEAPNGVKVISTAPSMRDSDKYLLGYLFDNNYEFESGDPRGTNPRTYWLTQSSNNQEIVIDLSSLDTEFSVAQLKVAPRTRVDASSDYRVLQSPDGNEYYEVISWTSSTHTSETPYGTINTHEVDVDSKFIKIELTRNGDIGCTLNEIEIYISQSKYIFQDGNRLVTYDTRFSNPWSEVGIIPVTQNMFNEGVGNPNIVPQEHIDLLESDVPEVLQRTDNDPLDDLDSLSYRILLEEDTIIEWSDYEEGSVFIDDTVPNSAIKKDRVNTVTIEYRDDIMNHVLQHTEEFYRDNTAPRMFGGSIDPASAHDLTDVRLLGTIVDSEEDQISYRVLVNSREIRPWSILEDSPVQVDYRIRPIHLTGRNNLVRVEFMDQFDRLGSWESEVAIVNTNPIVSASVSPKVVHKEGVNLKANLSDPDSDQLSYRIVVNDRQVYPLTGYTDPAVSPVIVDYNIENSHLHTGDDNIIRLEFIDDFVFEGGDSWETQVSVSNRAPEAEVTMSADEVHAEDVRVRATISDPDEDKVAYRLFVGDTQIFPEDGWSEYIETPYDIDHYIPNDLFERDTTNLLRLEFRDDFKEGATSSWSGGVYTYDSPTTLTTSLSGLTFRATIEDEDRDYIRYRILLNGNVVYPSTGSYSPAQRAPLDIVRNFTSEEVVIGETNTISLEVFNEFTGQSQTVSREFIGDYTGVLFEDIDGNYYSTDQGDILQLLRFDYLIAGESTPISEVRIRNKFGFRVNNLTVRVDNNELPDDISIELSKDESEMTPILELEYDEVLGYNEYVIMYVRLVADPDANPNRGQFDIVLRAEPIE